MTKKPTKPHALAKRDELHPLDSLLPTAYPIAEQSITALQIFHNPERKPDPQKFDGPWNAEADKVGWIDEATGIRCIILRQKNGTLSGYVAVEPAHPLFGYEKDALPIDLANSVHGGVNYSRTCEENNHSQVRFNPRTERYTVCHVAVTRTVWDTKTVQDTADEFPEEDAWWFGFNTDHRYDLIPMHGRRQEQGAVYRDQAYVYAECIALAKKLRAIGDGYNAEAAKTPMRLGLPAPRGSNRANHSDNSCSSEGESE